eukprot:scaffold1146_cov339-Pavlova_lutheri.AAC.3
MGMVTFDVVTNILKVLCMGRKCDEAWEETRQLRTQDCERGRCGKGNWKYIWAMDRTGMVTTRIGGWGVPTCRMFERHGNDRSWHPLRPLGYKKSSCLSYVCYSDSKHFIPNLVDGCQEAVLYCGLL